MDTRQACGGNRGQGGDDLAQRIRSRIGEQLLKVLETKCDTSKFFVTTNLSNHRMQRLLLRMGYSPCGYIGELDPGDPELVFVKKIKADAV